ncbi:Ankyrin repeats (3 copies) [Popillia japonica]|uniref:Ankyrin repeats (3 copies) n=1 Tax=Popillia japonica TaxID=7064 RepID=A0AAW1KH64_POPJA
MRSCVTFDLKAIYKKMSAGSNTIDVDAFDQALLTREFGVASKLLPKIDIETQDSNGQTYLMRACVNNEVDVFEWLVQNHANTNVQDQSGRNLLFMAIQSGSLGIVKWLANNSKNVLYTTHNGQTPLHAAVSNNQFEIVKVLVAAGLDPDVQNQNRDTSFDLAQTLGDKTILQWLIVNKAFEILDGSLYEEGKVAALESLFGKYEYQYLKSKSAERNMTIAEHAANMQQFGILKWLKSKMIPVDESLLTGLSNAPIETYNILLVGETGVGKSTFINAFMNYLNFESLDQAENAKSIHALIPSSFTIIDQNFEQKRVEFGNDTNESHEPGASATQSARSYVFETGDVRIRLIDTPGIGDTRGIGKDEENFDRLLAVIGELKDIHGICIMLKPNNARLTVLFEYCVKQLLSRLQKDASRNIMFLFTNSRSTFYRPGDTFTPLKKILSDLKSKPPYITIPLGKENTFSLDNEAFRFLLARRNNIIFDEDEKENFERSWSKSAKVSINLLKYMKSLKPHKIQDTVSLNEARRLILRLSAPLAEIAGLIEDNIQTNTKYEAILSNKTKSIDELKKYLKVPRIGLKVIPLDHPMTVCINKKCVETIKVGDTIKRNYTQICHLRCYLNNIQKEVIGDLELRTCWAMIEKNGTMMCRHAACGHNFREHMHIYYKTEAYNYEDEDKIVAGNIAKNKIDNKIDVKDIENKIEELNEMNKKYRIEMKIIQKSMAKFAHFLKNNAITAFNDTYRKYIEYLIDRERNTGEGGDKNLIEGYNKLILTYFYWIQGKEYGRRWRQESYRGL